MAGDPKVVRGSLEGVSVQVSEETAANLGASFEPEKAAAKKSSTTK